MDQAISRFLGHLQTDKGFSPNTVVAYKNDLFQLLAFLRDGPAIVIPLPETWAGVTAGMAERYFLTLQERHYAPATIARKIASVKSFFHFLEGERSIVVNPADGFASPGVRRPLPKTISSLEVDELLDQPLKREKPEGKRDWAMLSMLYATGMRVTELVKLNVEDVFLDEHYPYVRCLGRASRPRDIPLPPASLESLHEYLVNGRDRLVRSPETIALFLNRRGERLTRQGFWLILKSHVRSANLRGEITPHMLRHTFATHMLQSGQLNLRELQGFLGHASISTTQIYTQLPEAAAAGSRRTVRG